MKINKKPIRAQMKEKDKDDKWQMSGKIEWPKERQIEPASVPWPAGDRRAALPHHKHRCTRCGVQCNTSAHTYI